jgi:hypothetical protein
MDSLISESLFERANVYEDPNHELNPNDHSVYFRSPISIRP